MIDEDEDEDETDVVNEDRGVNNVENLSEGENSNSEIEEQEKSTAPFFPVSIDLKDNGHEALVGFKGLYAIDYFLKKNILLVGFLTSTTSFRT